MNKPVAWIVIDVDTGKSLQFEENKFAEVNIPLYTNPVKELTEDDILKVIKRNPFTDGYLNKNLIDFSRAILRKAQENGCC